ncbi:hypothetical protein [Lactococcus allomyrinae]|uniref:Uncharacterized protein n=2 Tax=Lactococcus TaxID=1357 RepID=A0A387BJT3_9LACT|nr:hypothetical protein [Lactococcus allomyrinae]AYG01297.1 hypothetical protein D7I46_09425 [Lactococcus allomyrinae]
MRLRKKEIAKKMGWSISTVENHLRAMKCDVNFSKYIHKYGYRTLLIDLEGYLLYIDFLEKEVKKAM